MLKEQLQERLKEKIEEHASRIWQDVATILRKSQPTKVTGILAFYVTESSEYITYKVCTSEGERVMRCAILNAFNQKIADAVCGKAKQELGEMTDIIDRKLRAFVVPC